MKYYLAIDIGASSGRHIVGDMKDGELMTEEVYRFPNGMDTEDGHLVWDTDRLFREVKAGIAESIKRFGKIEHCYWNNSCKRNACDLWAEFNLCSV